MNEAGFMAAQGEGGVTEAHRNGFAAWMPVGDDTHGFAGQEADFDQAQNDMLFVGSGRCGNAGNSGRDVALKFAKADFSSRGGG